MCAGITGWQSDDAIRVGFMTFRMLTHCSRIITQIGAVALIVSMPISTAHGGSPGPDWYFVFGQYGSANAGQPAFHHEALVTIGPGFPLDVENRTAIEKAEGGGARSADISPHQLLPGIYLEASGSGYWSISRAGITPFEDFRKFPDGTRVPWIRDPLGYIFGVDMYCGPSVTTGCNVKVEVWAKKRKFPVFVVNGVCATRTEAFASISPDIFGNEEAAQLKVGDIIDVRNATGATNTEALCNLRKSGLETVSSLPLPGLANSAPLEETVRIVIRKMGGGRPDPTLPRAHDSYWVIGELKPLPTFPVRANQASPIVTGPSPPSPPSPRGTGPQVSLTANLMCDDGGGTVKAFFVNSPFWLGPGAAVGTVYSVTSNDTGLPSACPAPSAGRQRIRTGTLKIKVTSVQANTGMVYSLVLTGTEQ